MSQVLFNLTFRLSYQSQILSLILSYLRLSKQSQVLNLILSYLQIILAVSSLAAAGPFYDDHHPTHHQVREYCAEYWRLKQIKTEKGKFDNLKSDILKFSQLFLLETLVFVSKY